MIPGEKYRNRMARAKILIVDDEKVIRDVFTSAFKEYRIVSADNGQKALTILNQPNDIVLIVVDAMMPGLSGTELLKEIKRINPGCKVIIFTGYGFEEGGIEALLLDADGYLEKPFDIKKAKEMFERVLRKKGNFNEERAGDAEGKIS